MEIVVDCYDQIEQAMGWHAYLGDRLAFPFAACCRHERSASPLHADERVEVVGMADSDDCLCEMAVEVRWMERTFAAPLEQLEPLGADAATEQAVADWTYWADRGYSLC